MFLLVIQKWLWEDVSGNGAGQVSHDDRSQPIQPGSAKGTCFMLCYFCKFLHWTGLCNSSFGCNLSSSVAKVPCCPEMCCVIDTETGVHALFFKHRGTALQIQSGRGKTECGIHWFTTQVVVCRWGAKTCVAAHEMVQNDGKFCGAEMNLDELDSPDLRSWPV